MAEIIELSGEIDITQHGQRLDQALAELFADYSRSRIKNWILAGQVTVDGTPCTVARQKMLGGEQIVIRAEIETEERWEAQPIALDIVYEDDDILVINKPADLVVHPGAGNADGTVLNALLHHVPALASVPRAGIVHRLDKDTTGLMVVAKTIPAQTSLVAQLQARSVTREYQAVVLGRPTGGGRIEKAIGRHPTKRTHMAVHELGKPAITQYRLAKRFRAHSLLHLRLETGRTHQIRVHMAYLGFPLVGDQVYGGRPRLPKASSDEMIAMLRGFKRQALHARMLQLDHPVTGERMQWEVPAPDDFQQLLSVLEADLREHGSEDDL